MPDTLTENDENVQEEPEVSDTDTTNVSTQDKRKEMPAKISSFISPVKTNEKNSSNKEITSSDLSNWTLTTVNERKRKIYTYASEYFLTFNKKRLVVSMQKPLDDMCDFKVFHHKFPKQM